jgi:hypothetical protein
MRKLFAMDRRFPARLWSYLRRRWINVRRVRFWVVVLVVLYTLGGFLVLPWAAGTVAVDTVRDDFGRELSIGNIDVNPYTFSLEITDLALADRDDHPLVAFDRLWVNFTLASLWERAWTFQAVSLDGLVVQEERFPSGETRFTRLAGEASGEPADSAEPTAQESGGIPGVVIRELDLSAATLRFVDRLDESATGEIELRDVGVSVENARLHEDQRFPIGLTARSAAGGELRFDGGMRLSPAFALEGQLQVDALAFAPAEPWLRQFVRVGVESGSASLAGQLSVGGEDPLAWRGGVEVDALSLVPDAREGAVLGWRALKIERVDLSLGERRVETSPVSIDALTGRVLIREDKSTNIGDLLVERPGAGDEGSQAANGDGDKPAVPFNFNLAGGVVSDGDVRFADRSLPLPFATRIHELEGELSTLASNTEEPVRVNMEGQVDEYGLARIEGTVDAWDPMRKTSVQLTFRNMQVPHYSPYTVAFAGRRIAAGRMDLNLGYTISGGRLEGRNSIILRELELGEEIEYPGAMDLPLGLAVALLKNSEGVIDMELPVTGDVGSPEFQLGGVIRKALADAITSVVSSPFRFLAGLVGADDEDLGRIAFPAGRSDLTPPQRERVALLREALANRPGLVLELPGPYDPERDRPALQRRKAVAELAERLRAADRDASSPGLTAEATGDVVAAMFARLYPDTSVDTLRQEFTRSDQELAESDSRFDGVAYRRYLAEKVIAAQTVSEADLAGLGEARAATVRDVLIQKGTGSGEAAGVEPDRVRIAEPEAVSPDDGQIVMEVGVVAE